MTHLVGRMLRKPHALKIGVEALDECHPITHHADAATVVRAVKRGLEQDGLGEIVLRVSSDDARGREASEGSSAGPLSRERKSYLPKVMIVGNGGVRDLDYETDILSEIDWRDFDPGENRLRIPDNARAAESRLQRIGRADDSEGPFVSETVADSGETYAFRPAHAVRMISDLVPNPVVGREIVGGLLDALRARGFHESRLGRVSGLIVEGLRKGLDAERAARAEARFKAEVAAGRIQFRSRLDGRNWRMAFSVETSEPESARQLLGKTGGPPQKSVFVPAYESEPNRDERDIAVYLDGAEALMWWHRNVAPACNTAYMAGRMPRSIWISYSPFRERTDKTDCCP